MTDLKITGINPGASPARSGPSRASGEGFDNVLDEVIGKLSQVQNDAAKATAELASGGDITQAVIAMEQADMNFQLMVEVRNKLIAAYEEVMRTQI